MILKVITLNIRHADDLNGNTRKERLPRIKEVLSPYDADIINYQEYTEWWDELRTDLLGDKYDCYLKYRSDKGEAAFITWKKDKFECLEKSSFWLSETPDYMSKSEGWDDVFDCYRICSYVILKEKESGKVFTVMNTHYGFGDYGQVKSSKLICERAKNISNYPTFVTGDFNMNPSASAYAEIIKYFKDVNMETVKDLSSTFHGYGKSEKFCLFDYCFVDENITPLESKKIDALIDGMYLSDHYPVYYKLEI